MKASLLRSAPFVLSIFTSAFLLFVVQPMVAQMLLPGFGGSPAVWTTSLVFFQTVLLLGYLYAHGLARLGGRGQLAVHSLALLLPVALLPPVVTRGPDPETLPPQLAVLVLLSVSIGPAFLVLSTNSILVQHWWARREGRGSHDPYWLYAASNAGSLLALLAYPLLVTPLMGIGRQTIGFSVGYVGFAALTLGILVLAARRDGRDRRGARYAAGAVEAGRASGAAPALEPGGAPSLGRRVGWVARAAVGTSLLLSLTMRITTDVAAVPLFWVVPLALYLLTYILAFGVTRRLRRSWIAAGAVFGTALTLIPLVLAGAYPVEWVLAISLVTLFLGDLLCHHDLALGRPPTRYLTGYYLLIAVGGALGGVLNSVVAPWLFDRVAEFPLTLLALAVLVALDPRRSAGPPRRGHAPDAPGVPPAGERPGGPAGSRTGARWGLGMAAFAGLAVGALGLVWLDVVGPGVALAGLALVGLPWMAGVARFRSFFPVSLALATPLLMGAWPGPGRMVDRERSFFGVVRVVDREGLRYMYHGTTVHGTQPLDPGHRDIPGPYYHPSSPLGRAVMAQRPGARIGVIGLGTGGLAALAGPARRLTFHEIDPLVVEVARRHFTFLDQAAGRVRVVLGDGRLTLARVPDGHYDLLVVDAFSSDAIPTHLLTAEALELYLRKVRASGLILLHISNREIDLERVLRGYAIRSGRTVLTRFHDPDPAAARFGARLSHVAALAPAAAPLERLLADPAWRPLRADGGPAVLWTDNHTDLLATLR